MMRSGALRAIGGTFVGLGVVILLFVGYQLVGTGFVTRARQGALAEELRASWSTASASSPTAPAPSADTLAKPPVPEIPPPELGSGISLIEIPRIGLRQVVVEGVGVEELKKGPGHMPETPLPGRVGNVVISGHRTTYGAPFSRIDELSAGDEIRLTTEEGLHVYKVTGNKIVVPTDLSVVAPTEDARLTLTTCHPRFSARRRLIVSARLVASGERARAA
ncbi:MAG: class E sortase [Actinomycetota bacterium]